MQRKAGYRDMARVQEMLEQAMVSDCLQCWLSVCHTGVPSPPHVHEHHGETHLIKKTVAYLDMIVFPRHVYWPFCYSCWVTYEAPCKHPRHTHLQQLDTSQCPAVQLIPRIIAFILTTPGYVDDVYTALKPESDEWDNPQAFYMWLQRPTSTADVLPNHYRFLLAFHTLCIDPNSVGPYSILRVAPR